MIYTLVMFFTAGVDIISLDINFPSLEMCNAAIKSSRVNYGSTTQASAQLKCVKTSK